MKTISKVESLIIDYNGRKVKAKRVSVNTALLIDINKAWNNVKTPALLEFVSKGMINFKTLDGAFPKQWEVGQTYRFMTRVLGFIPFGGIHYLFVAQADDKNYILSTKEWDNGAKVWNHTISLRALGDGKINYEDSIIIYAGLMTDFVASFAKLFYKHRQKRWQIIAANNLNFGM